MKKLLVLLILLTAGLQGFGRIVDDEKGLTAGVGLGLGQLYRNHDTYVMIQPKVGYRFNQRVEAGVMGRVDVACFHRWFDETETAFSYGGYINYSYLIKGPLSFVVSGRAMHIENKYGERLMMMTPRIDEASTNEFGITPGVRYKLRCVPVELTLNYIFLGYMDYKKPWDYKDAPGCWGSRWVLDMGLRRLEIGAAVTF